MSKREGKDDYGDVWRLNINDTAYGYALLSIEDGDTAEHVYTPTQARELATALNELADELDPPGKDRWSS